MSADQDIDRLRRERDEARAELADLRARYCPGHTDMMVTPEQLDAWLEKNPRPEMTYEEMEHRLAFAEAALSTSCAQGFRECREARRGIYIVSKTKHAHRWRFLRDKVGEPIISTWIDEAGEGETSDHHDLWRRCISEAAGAALLIVYREPDEALKGGWIEMGAALARGVPVYAVGIEEFTVAKYRVITHFPDIKSAIAASRTLVAAALPEPSTDGGVG